MTSLSTHVLDAARGEPVAGLAVSLRRADATREEGADGTLQDAATDADGRVRFGPSLEAGEHELVFATGAWFAAQDRPTFYPTVRIAFDVDPGQPHYHVALLLSPFSYTTYRGS